MYCFEYEMSPTDSLQWSLTETKNLYQRCRIIDVTTWPYGIEVFETGLQEKSGKVRQSELESGSGESFEAQNVNRNILYKHMWPSDHRLNTLEP
jgi:hypothetical protein